MKRIALLIALVLVVAACGDDDSVDATTTQAPTATTAADDMTDTTESMTDDEMTDESMADDEMTEEDMTDEDMTDEGMTESMSPEGVIFEITSVIGFASDPPIRNSRRLTSHPASRWRSAWEAMCSFPRREPSPSRNSSTSGR
jgi:hypothetical protein